jgi:hypothetical protein
MELKATTIFAAFSCKTHHFVVELLRKEARIMQRDTDTIIHDLSMLYLKMQVFKATNPKELAEEYKKVKGEIEQALRFGL